MIAAVTCVKNEADIIGQNIRHLFANGIDFILVKDGMSTDGTRDVLSDLLVEFAGHLRFSDDRNEVFKQVGLMNELVDSARVIGADWIVPFDADEFIYPAAGTTIAEALNRMPHGVGSLSLTPYLQRDWDNRFVGGENRWPKVVFREHRGARVSMGNHAVYGVPGQTAPGVLALRELQFRGYEHFRAKVALNLQTLDRSLPLTHAAHYRCLEHLTNEEMEQAWEAYVSRPTVLDPVPSSFPPLIAGS